MKCKYAETAGQKWVINNEQNSKEIVFYFVQLMDVVMQNSKM